MSAPKSRLKEPANRLFYGEPLLGRRESPKERAARSFYGEPPPRAVPQFRLESATERAAIGRLRPSWGGQAQQAEFRQLVLAHLHLIASRVELGPSSGPPRDKPSKMVRELKRRTSQVRSFAARLEKRFPVPLLALPLPPIRELRLYADGLETYARSLADRAKSPSVVSAKTVPLSSLLRPSLADLAAGPSLFVGRPQKRKARPETKLVLDLIRLVRQHTGRAHWNDLATLLKRPCRDVGVSKDRLRALWKSEARHASPSRHRAHFPRPRSRTPFGPAV